MVEAAKGNTAGPRVDATRDAVVRGRVLLPVPLKDEEGSRAPGRSTGSSRDGGEADEKGVFEEERSSPGGVLESCLS